MTVPWFLRFYDMDGYTIVVRPDTIRIYDHSRVLITYFN